MLWQKKTKQKRYNDVYTHAAYTTFSFCDLYTGITDISYHHDKNLLILLVQMSN